jgi:hypothetical protein
MANALRVLIIDDDKDYVESLSLDARAKPYQIIIEHAENLEDGIDLYNEKGPKAFSGIILDILCLKDREQQIPDKSFLPLALTKFSRIAPVLPLVVLTGESDNIEEHRATYQATANVYLKGSDEVEKMLAHLRSEGNKLEDNRIKQSYAKEFSIFEKEYLDTDVEQDLVSCLKDMRSQDFGEIKDNLARLRRIQEAIFIKLNRVRPNMVPDMFMTTKKNTRVDVKNAMGGLLNNDFVPRDSIIHKFSDNNYDVCSANGSHKPYGGPEKEIFYKPTWNTVQSCTYATLDLLLWFKGVMEKK